MPTFPITFVTRHYDMVTPLLTGEVRAAGIELRLDCDTPMGAFLSDESIDAAELSLSQYLRRLAAGDREIVGLPIILCRGFRQRLFFVRRDSGLTSLSDLAGRRVGTNGWPDTGNTWSRSLLREVGVDLASIAWTIGPIDDVTHPLYGPPVVNTAGRPAHVNVVSGGSTLSDLLLAGDLDAIMANRAPFLLYEADSPVARLFPNYRQVEEEYATRVGFYPGHHITGIRRSIVEDQPWVAASLVNVFDTARRLVEQRRFVLADSAPWQLEEFERVEQILGPDWQAHGIEPNQALFATICREFVEQGIIDTPVDPVDLFEDYQRLSGA